MLVFLVAICTFAAISFPCLRRLDQRRASVALADYCVSAVSCVSQSLWLLLLIVLLQRLALQKVPSSKNQSATFLAPIVRLRAPVQPLLQMMVSLLVLLSFSQGPAGISQCSGGMRTQKSVAIALRPLAGFAVLSWRNYVLSTNSGSLVVYLYYFTCASSFLLHFLV